MSHAGAFQIQIPTAVSNTVSFPEPQKSEARVTSHFLYPPDTVTPSPLKVPGTATPWLRSQGR